MILCFLEKYTKGFLRVTIQKTMCTLVGSKIKIHDYTPNPEINNQEGIIINILGSDKYTIQLSNGVQLSLNSKYMIFPTSPKSLTNQIANTSNIEDSKETS